MLDIQALDEGGEPAVGALLDLRFRRSRHPAGDRAKAGLIVEAEAIGEDGRLTLREDADSITARNSLRRATRYAGYRELGRAREQVESCRD